MLKRGQRRDRSGPPSESPNETGLVYIVCVNGFIKRRKRMSEDSIYPLY